MNRYQQLPAWLAFVSAAVVAFVLAVIAGMATGLTAIYLYDRGQSKGNDFAVGLIGLHACGTFVFVVVFSWLRSLHSQISWQIPLAALAFCLCGAAVSTASLWSNLDYYTNFMVIGWVAIVLGGAAGLLTTRQFFPLGNSRAGRL